MRRARAQQILDLAVARVVGAQEGDDLDRAIERGEDLAGVVGEHEALLGREVDAPAGARDEQLGEDQRRGAADRADQRRQPAPLRRAHRCPRQWRASSTRRVQKTRRTTTRR